eukprot:TRINITY_DN11872_c0_g1_i1.p1 TRINITY_DN11872_c0_g1~~TRINITY_DN11872_c0_g1_i1.p1  ORF type:complete len:426 (+),score=108.91 TRINITY_DN11872_c0_g1_i1:135-1412(+)
MSTTSPKVFASPHSTQSVTSVLTKLEDDAQALMSTLQLHKKAEESHQAAQHSDDEWYKESLARLRLQHASSQKFQSALADRALEIASLRKQLQAAEQRANQAEAAQRSMEQQLQVGLHNIPRLTAEAETAKQYALASEEAARKAELELDLLRKHVQSCDEKIAHQAQENERLRARLRQSYARLFHASIKHAQALHRQQHGQETLRQQIESTMRVLKGRVMMMTQEGAGVLARCLVDVRGWTDKQHLFKVAHSKVKRCIVEIAGEQPSGDRWTFPPELIDRMAPHYRRQLLKVMQELVVAFDNLPDDVKDNLTTAEEIVVNTDYLIRIADFCTRHVSEQRASVASIASTGQAESDTPFHTRRLSVLSASAAVEPSPPPLRRDSDISNKSVISTQERSPPNGRVADGTGRYKQPQSARRGETSPRYR